MLSEKIIYIGIIINIFFYIPYIKGILRGDIKPNLVSFSIWTLAPLIGVFIQLKAGANLSVLGTFMAGFGPFLVIIFSLINKNSFWKINTFDIYCGLLSLIALIIYIVTNNLEVSILFAILSDGLAAVPTIIKSWKFPKSEGSSLYIGGIINNVLSLFIITNWSFSIYAFSVYLIIINIIIIFAINYKKIINNLKK